MLVALLPKRLDLRTSWDLNLTADCLGEQGLVLEEAFQLIQDLPKRTQGLET